MHGILTAIVSRNLRQRGLCLVVGLAAPKSMAISVEELPDLVRSSNRDLKVSQTEIHAAESDVHVALARYAPSVKLKTTYTHLDRDIVLDIPNQHIERPILGSPVIIGIDVNPPQIDIQNKNMLMANLVMTQPLYTGGRISAGLDAANAGLELARAESDQTYRERLAEALTRYFQVRTSELALSVLQLIDKDLQEIAVTAQGAVKAGAVPQFAVMQVKVTQADIAAKILEATSNLKLATLAFKDSVGIDALSAPPLDSPLLKVPLIHGLDVFKTKALTDRTEFRILDQKKAQVEALKTAKTGEMLPTMVLFGAYNVARENLPLLTPKWAVGVELDIPLTSGLSQFSEREKASSLAQKVSLLRAKAQAQIPLQVESLFDQCQAQFAELATLESSLALATEVQRLAVTRLKSGTGSAVEVLKATADRQGMEAKRIMLLEEYNRHMIELYQASGSIDRYVEAYHSARATGVASPAKQKT